jgi:hypothetical protein
VGLKGAGGVVKLCRLGRSSGWKSRFRLIACMKYRQGGSVYLPHGIEVE